MICKCRVVNCSSATVLLQEQALQMLAGTALQPVPSELYTSKFGGKFWGKCTFFCSWCQRVEVYWPHVIMQHELTDAASHSTCPWSIRSSRGTTCATCRATAGEGSLCGAGAGGRSLQPEGDVVLQSSVPLWCCLLYGLLLFCQQLRPKCSSCSHCRRFLMCFSSPAGIPW